MVICILPATSAVALNNEADSVNRVSASCRCAESMRTRWCKRRHLHLVRSHERDEREHAFKYSAKLERCIKSTLSEEGSRYSHYPGFGCSTFRASVTERCLLIAMGESTQSSTISDIHRASSCVRI